MPALEADVAGAVSAMSTIPRTAALPPHAIIQTAAFALVAPVPTPAPLRRPPLHSDTLGPATSAPFLPAADAVSAPLWINASWTLPAAAGPAHATRHAYSADALATAAYTELARGERRAAAENFTAAIAADPADPRAAAWRAQLHAIDRRWSGSAYIFARAGGPADFATAALLGGGQSGAMLAYTPDPRADHPIALTLRGAVAHDGFGIDTATAQGALGVRWSMLPGVTLAGEWLVASSSGAAHGWSLRLAGGASGSRGPIDWSLYGETGAVDYDPFAAAQAYVGARIPLHADAVRLSAGAGIWGGVQDSGGTADRIDIGPSVRLHGARLPVALTVDYRFRVAGNAAPGSGVALTLSAGF
jgi:hypothetical protein